MMVVTPVRAHNSIKPDGIGRVADSPVVSWILGRDLVDSTFSKPRAFLAEDFNQSGLRGTLHHCLVPDRRFESRLN